MSVRLLSWNILQGGGKRARDIAAQIETIQPDIVTLQEFRAGKSAPVLLETLSNLGLNYQHTIDAPARKNTVMVAANTPFDAAPWASDLEPELCVKTTFNLSHTETDSLTVFAGHLPQKRAQVPYLDTLNKLDSKEYDAALIIGDLNCGIPFEDSETKSFVNTNMFQSLLRNGWTDSWRKRNPEAREYTWISSRGNGYRYDHCLANAKADSLISNITYIQSLREERLSDHAAILVELDLPTGPREERDTVASMLS